MFKFLSEASDNEHLCCLLRQLEAQSTTSAASTAVTETTATATETTAERQPPPPAKPAEPVDAHSAATAGAVSQEEAEKATEGEPRSTANKDERTSVKRKGRASSKKRSKTTIARKTGNRSLVGRRFKKDFGEGFGIHHGASMHKHNININSTNAFNASICSHDRKSATSDDDHLTYHTHSLPGTVERALYISSRLHYHVRYEDSDSEDLAEVELLSLMQSPEQPAQ